MLFGHTDDMSNNPKSDGWSDGDLMLDDASGDDRNGDRYLDRLARDGILAEADAIFDDLDQGVNPCRSERLDDVLREVEQRRNR